MFSEAFAKLIEFFRGVAKTPISAKLINDIFELFEQIKKSNNSTSYSTFFKEMCYLVDQFILNLEDKELISSFRSEIGRSSAFLVDSIIDKFETKLNASDKEIAELKQNSKVQDINITNLKQENKEQNINITEQNIKIAAQNVTITKLKQENKEQTINITKLKQNSKEQNISITKLKQNSKEQDVKIAAQDIKIAVQGAQIDAIMKLLSEKTFTEKNGSSDEIIVDSVQ